MNEDMKNNETSHKVPVFIADNLSKTYSTAAGTQTEALKKVSLEIYQGEFFVLVGPSGCGKSTLLRILSGILPKTEGMIYLEDKVITKPNDKICVAFQTPVLFPWLTVFKNVMLPFKIRQSKIDSNNVEKAYSTLKMMGLEDFKDCYPYELSGGMQQRAALARTLVLEPKILLMDEPFASLDALTRETMAVELLNIHYNQKITILFITHSITEAVMLADRVGVLSARPGTLKKIFNVDFPRPRNLNVIYNSKFGELTAEIRNSLEETV